MAKDLETRLIATDNASKVIDQVADKLEDLEKQGDAAIEITAEDKASDEIRSVSQRLAGLSDEDKTIVIKAQVTDAEKDIARILKSLARVDEMDDEEIQIRVEALDKAKAKLDRLQSQVRDLDGETVDIKVEAKGLNQVTDKLGAMPGQLGQLGGAISGGPVAAVGALVVGAVGAAKAFADTAAEAQVMADLTGASIEDASRLQSVWTTTGADVNDLNDVLLQMNGVLKDSPQFAEQLGVSFDKNESIVSRFIKVIEALEHSTLDAAEKADLMSQLFGEEGVRQVQKLVSTIDGPLASALANVGEAQVIDEEEAEKAKELNERIKELETTWNGFVLSLGEIALGPVGTALEKINLLLGGERIPGGALDQARTDFEALLLAEGKFTDQMKREVIERNNLTNGLSAFEARLAATIPTYDAAAAATKSATSIIQEQIDKQLGQKQAKEFRAARDAAEEYNDVISSPGFGRLDLQGGLTAMSAFTDQFNSLNTLAINFETAMDGITTSVKEGGFTFDLATEAGRKNQEALGAVADTLDVRLAAAYANADGDMQKFKDSANVIGLETLGRLQEELGLSAEETQILAEKLGLLPEDLETRYRMAGVEEAKLKLGLLQSAIDLLPRDVQTQVTQQIIAGDYVGALATVENYYATHPANLPSTVDEPTNTVAVRNTVQDYFRRNPLQIPARVVGFEIAQDAGGVTPPSGGIAAEVGPEFAQLPSGKKLLLTGPTLVPPGTRVTSRRETARILRHRPHFDSGTGGAVAPVNVNVRIDTGGVFSNEFAFARVVRRAVNDGVRLAGSRS